MTVSKLHSALNLLINYSKNDSLRCLFKYSFLLFLFFFLFFMKNFIFTISLRISNLSNCYEEFYFIFFFFRKKKTINYQFVCSHLAHTTTTLQENWVSERDEYFFILFSSFNFMSYWKSLLNLYHSTWRKRKEQKKKAKRKTYKKA